MVEYTLLEKIKMLFNLVFSSSLFLILLIGVLVFLLDIFYISNKSLKVKYIYSALSLLLLIGLGYNYFKQLLDVINVVNKSLVRLINFPSVMEYVIILLILIIVMIISLISKKINRVIKGINIGVLITNVYLFFLILDLISKNNIDLSNKVEIYSNQNLMILFQLSLLIFVLWILVLIIYKICKLLIYKSNKIMIKQEDLNNNLANMVGEDIEIPKRKEEITNFYDEIEMPITIEELRKRQNEDQYKKIDDLQSKVIDGVFTLEEFKEMKSLLENLKKNK